MNEKSGELFSFRFLFSTPEAGRNSKDLLGS